LISAVSKLKSMDTEPEDDAERSAAAMKQRFAKVDAACRKHPDVARRFDAALKARNRLEIERLWDWLEAQD
jgi:hypothetical protein